MIDFSKDLLFRDALLLVINKPSGVAVHKGMGNGPHLEDTLKELAFGLPNPPQLAHRLDAGTSGCLILGRHKVALKHLGHLFETNQIKKTYWAIVIGHPEQDSGVIDFPLMKQSQDKRRWWMKVDPHGQEAITEYRVLHRSDCNLSFLELTPITGRTHQLRVHCQAMGFPILGDAIYGYQDDTRHMFLHLHARGVEIPYHQKKPVIKVVAPLSPHMLDTCTEYGVEYTSGYGMDQDDK
ncbi:MAG: RNA pseudouridine synthase [Candidatus Paracaedibacteraceae bacterium]|nr:RNA pseudouridine synthase [Candidatus Paracaedibacteraceae bacterium]